MTARRGFWLVGAALWLLFCFWYTNTEGPMTQAEIDQVINDAKANGAPEEQISHIRKFLENDDGDDFVMVNNLHLNPNPPNLPATGPDADANDLMNHYMEYMFPALFARACHPLFMGGTLHQSMDIVGIEGAEVWTSGALMRYRSRRDMVEIAFNPVFAERHEYKVGSLEKTIAYPVSNPINPTDGRVFIGMVMLILWLLLDLIFFRRKSVS